MTRLPDWEARLSAYLADRHARSSFGYAHVDDPDQDDCCTFGGGAVLAMTGIDPMPEFRGRYRTARGSLRALRRHGAGTLEATLDGKFGRVRPSFAQRGDLVMVNGMMGVCVGADAMLVGRDGEREGLVRFGRADWQAAWAV